MNEAIADPIDLLTTEHVLGPHPFQAEALPSGATSRAWRVHSDQEDFVIRMPRLDSKRPITYRSEHRILDALCKQGQPVPAPMRLSTDTIAPAWSMTGPVTGQPLGNRSLPPEAAVQLGRFLQILHGLPCSGYGRLIESDPELRGQQVTAVEGMRARWCWAALLPFDQSTLSKHVISRLAPQLLDRLLLIQPHLWMIATDPRRVINHADLHGQHIFVDAGRLSGVIDFGAVFVGVPAWDFAVLAYYHGWEIMSIVLDHYTSDAPGRHEILRQARYLALVVALYKLEKTVHRQPTKQNIERIIRFITDTLLILEES